jgi:hypothetical protein
MLLKNNNVKAVLKIFFEAPAKRFQLRELSRASGLSTTGVKSVLLELLGSKLVAKTREKKYEFYEANRNGEDYKLHKKFFNVRLLYDSGVLDYLEKELNHPEAMLLFGSASKGEDAETSDIDLFVLASVKKDHNLELYERKLRRGINLIVMARGDFERAKEKNPELVNNIVNGFLLKGFLEVL